MSTQTKPQTKHHPYPTYKPSGVEWLGEVPAHWKDSKVKHIADYLNGLAFKPSEWSSSGLKIIRIQNLTNPSSKYNYYSGLKDRKYIISKGAILIAWSASLGVYLWNDDEKGWLNQHIFKVTVNKKKVTKGFYLWLSKWFILEMEKDAHGSTMQHVTKDKFGTFILYLPPFPEQRAIADFLDRKTAQIDALIAKKEQLIALLKEKRAALINQAVTKGLNPDAPMKDSGIEWLGEVPAHWDVKLVKFLSKIKPEYGLNIGSEAYTDGGVRFLRTTDIDDNGKIITNGVYLPLEVVEEYFILKDGDFLISRSGTVGRAYVHQENESLSTFAGYLIRFRFDNTTRAKYLFWFTKSRCFLEWINLNRIESTISNVNGQKYANLAFSIPKLGDEIINVVDFLDLKTAQIDTLVEEINKQITHYQEYRTALISAAVTGKIDVRNHAPQ